MSEKSEKFFKKMLELLPSTEAMYRESIEFNGEILETVIIEDVFMAEIVKLIKEDKNPKLLETIFDYFEEVCNCEDEFLSNTFSVTVLEILGNDKNDLEIARKYMGAKTKRLQIEADIATLLNIDSIHFAS